MDENVVHIKVNCIIKAQPGRQAIFKRNKIFLVHDTSALVLNKKNN